MAHSENKDKLAKRDNSCRFVQCRLVDQASRRSMISAKRVGSMRSSWRQCRVRYQEAQGLLKEKLFKGIGSKSEVSTGTKHNIKIRVANGSWSGRATVP